VGDELTRPFRDARRFPSTRWYLVPRATRTTLGVWDSSIVQGPFSVAPCRTLTYDSRFLCSSRWRVRGVARGRWMACWSWASPWGAWRGRRRARAKRSSRYRPPYALRWTRVGFRMAPPRGFDTWGETARERETSTPTFSQRTCSPFSGQSCQGDWTGETKRRRELISRPNDPYSSAFAPRKSTVCCPAAHDAVPMCRS
jgi:hypothetical protein